MPLNDRREEERLKTRAAILDATEELMREEGYAAVTSRRVGEKAGLKSQLVHYHFGSMDELFLEAFKRNEKKHFSRHLKLLKSKRPIKDLLELSLSLEGMDVVSEYVAAANHRDILKDELVQCWNRFRMFHTTLISKYFEEEGIIPGNVTPQLLMCLLTCMGKTFAEERKLGFTEGHDETIAFVEKLIDSLPKKKRAKRAPAALERKEEPAV
jgi:AcrR family transcriptional regulator